MDELERLALKYYVHQPAESASNFVRYAREIQTTPGVTFDSELLNKSILPVRPGRVMGILGRPGAGKTTVGATILATEARRLSLLPDFGGRYALHVSWEQSVEELESIYQASPDFSISEVAWGRVPLDDVVKQSIQRPKLPVWLFGESIYNSDFDAPPMTVEMVYAGIRAAYRQWNMLPSVIFMDYIQDIPVPDERERYSQVSAAMRLVKRLALHAKCPILLGIQAGRTVDTYQSQIPTMKDAEWSAVIEQKLDVLIALWKPIRTFLPHERPTIEVGGIPYQNDDYLLVIKLLKQRFEKGYGIWGVYFDPNRMILRDYATINF